MREREAAHLGRPWWACMVGGFCIGAWAGPEQGQVLETPENQGERLKFDVVETPHNVELSILSWENHCRCNLAYSQQRKKSQTTLERCCY